MSPPFPPREELVATVRDFLVRLRLKLDGEERYQAQVAAYLLDIVAREERSAEAAASPADLAAFRDAMRAGRFDDDALAETLLLQAAAEVRIVRPDHLDPLHREESS